MRRLATPSGAKTVSLELDGEDLPAIEGEPVAMSLLAGGQTLFSRSVKYHRPRGPFCLLGACGQCQMRVDGVPNVYTCRVRTRAGMRLERQNAFPSATLDLFAAVDFLFPRGLDPHHLLAGVPMAEDVMARVARHLAGLGRLPDRDAPPLLSPENLRARVIVVGGGASGSVVAQALADRGVDFLSCERETSHGSHWADPPVPFPTPERLLRPVTVLGAYRDATGRFLVALRERPDSPPSLLKLYADCFVFANGGHPTLLPFDDNDVPGVFAGAAAVQLLRHGLLVGERPALVGRGASLFEVHRALRAAGARPALVLQIGPERPQDVATPFAFGEPLQAFADTTVRALSYRPAQGGERRVECDAIIVCVPPAPSFELARQSGAQVSYRPASGGFVVEADGHGRTAAPGVFVTGILAGAQDAEASRASGARAASSILEAFA